MRVQGAAASRRVAWALRRLAGLDLDAIALVRGGGARSDLAAFDAEVVARTITDLPVPVLTGIGHETDRTVADEVAHTCAKTPTAAAGVLIRAVDAYLDDLERAAQRVAVRSRTTVSLAGRELGTLAHRVRRAGPAALGHERRTLDDHRRRAVHAGRRHARDAGQAVTGSQRALVASARRALARRRARARRC